MTGDDKFSIVAAENHLVVSLLEPIKSAAWDAIEEAGHEIVQQVEARETPRIAVDLTSLDYMGSSVVALLVRVWKAVQARSGKMVVVVDDGVVREVLQLAGLEKVWVLVENLETALDELGVSDAAVVQQRETRMLTFVGPVAAVAASIGLYILFIGDGAVQEYLGVISLFGCAVLAFGTSAVSVVREHGGKRTLSIIVVLWSVGVFGYGTKRVMDHPPSFLEPAEDQPVDPVNSKSPGSSQSKTASKNNNEDKNGPSVDQTGGQTESGRSQRRTDHPVNSDPAPDETESGDGEPGDDQADEVEPETDDPADGQTDPPSPGAPETL